MTAYVYMVRCANGHLYTGWTNDLAARLKAHQSGKGARYTRGFKAVSMVYYESLPDKSAALKREYAIKQLTKTQKEDMVAHFTGPLPPPVSLGTKADKKDDTGPKIK
jgi:putative endonuclease